MASRAVPVKTPEGQAELATRRLRLGQRHRTVLLLVDGKRSEAEVRQLAALAGVPATCFDELLGLSLISVPETAGEASQAARREGGGALPGAAATAGTGSASVTLPRMPAATETGTTPIEAIDAGPAVVEATAAAPAVAGRVAIDAAISGVASERAQPPEAPAPGPVPFPIAPDDSLLPAARTLPPDSVGSDSVLGGKPPPDSWLPAESADEEGGTLLDAVVAQARDMLVRAVRSEAPLAGTLTVLRLRRARDPTQLLELLDEVEVRLGRRQLSLAANQTLQSVRRLLERGEDGARAAA